MIPEYLSAIATGNRRPSLAVDTFCVADSRSGAGIANKSCAASPSPLAGCVTQVSASFFAAD